MTKERGKIESTHLPSKNPSQRVAFLSEFCVCAYRLKSHWKILKNKMERNYVGNGFPAFIKVYSPETCYLKLKIPSRFLKNLNGDIPVISLLEVEGSARRSWRVVIEKIEEDFYFKGGWTKFVQDNNLENEDYLNFLYAGNSTFSVKIYGKNGYLKQELNAIAELELHPLDEENPNEIQVVSPLAYEELDGSENSLVSVTLFEIVMKKSNFSKMLLNLPSTFGKKYMKRGQVFEKMATLQTDGKSWPVVVRSSDRLKLRKGWRQYLQDNDLHVGDVLRFKLIDEENFVLKVLIRRNQVTLKYYLRN